ncbi:hypothetical protein GCM10011339_24160 [Echinicola rosea]|uniref:T9SS C-terminal target domain-containing protein n=1 Tax=Echinicola rosea TaxID=1807691 RepID=A0ABQ1V1V5_9BACT|nr:hypothetical protein GCM10011339_24160 [Echinicola rosea]
MGDYPRTSTYNPNCQVDVVVEHNVAFDVNTSFGGGYFKSLTVTGSNGVLTFPGNLTFDQSGSSLPAPNNVVINVDNGGYIDVSNGSLLMNRGGVLNITGNSTVIVRDLELQSNNATINVEEGSRLIVLNSSTINSNTTLNLEGELITKSLNFNSGGSLISSGNSAINVSEDLSLGNGTLDLKDNAIISVGGDMSMSGGGALKMKDNTEAIVDGMLDINSTNPAELRDYATFIVDGIREGSIGSFSVLDYACYQSATDANNCASSLPVNFSNLLAQFSALKRKVNLYWSTYRESNNSHYEVERSFNGISSFTSIGEVSGSRWSNDLQQYTFVDTDLPLEAGRLYYRIKQVDADGEATFSKIIALDIPGLSAGKATWQIYPNPANGEQINLALINSQKYNGEEVSITIFNSLNQSRSFRASSIAELNLRLRKELAEFSKGLVLVKVGWADSSQLIKLLH